MENPDRYTGTTGYKDLYRLTTVDPGETQVYKGHFQMETVGSLAPILERAINKKGSGEPFGVVSGKVRVGGGRFAPEAPVTRAEAAVMLYNLNDKLETGNKSLS